ncbi:MAG: Fic family protein [Candidatus Sumerlaeota bacterium]|nr:Fic family protein [Candidatus Sumerlaeota bacterium]
MMTFKQFALKPETIPTLTTWYLADLGEAKGKQELFTRQSPSRLKALREHALIESAISSNRIEGITVDQSRIGTLIFGRPALRDRNEEEVTGYREALKLIHEHGAELPLNEATILELHRLSRQGVWDAGKYKDIDVDVIEKFADGGQRIRFKTVPAAQTPEYMKELIAGWHQCQSEQWIHPLIAMAAFNLDFLCIHPFRDGNGRVSRLLYLLQCYHLGHEAGRYISLERLIEQNKERYYETLQMSSIQWHEGKHNPWIYINFLLYILKSAHKDFEERFKKGKSPKGAKTLFVQESINSFFGDFTLGDLKRSCPGVSHDMIRKILRSLQTEGKIECTGRGPGAFWRKRGNTL